MGKGKAKTPEPLMTTYQPQMLANAQAAEAESPEMAAYRAKTNKLWKMYNGDETFDLSKMPGSNVAMKLYDNAKSKSDRGRIGKGLSYGGGPGAEGYNANLIAAIDQQNQDEKERDAAGQVESWVSNEFSGLDNKMLGIGDRDLDRRNQNWQRYANMHQTEAGYQAAKASKPKWWETMLGGGMSALGSWAGAGFAT